MILQQSVYIWGQKNELRYRITCELGEAPFEVYIYYFLQPRPVQLVYIKVVISASTQPLLGYHQKMIHVLLSINVYNVHTFI